MYETPRPLLARMLESVGAQSFDDWELLLVDDASAQSHLRDLLGQAAATDPRVHVKRRERSGGIVAASNDALGMASGEFVALLDPDDKLHPDALAHVHRALLGTPEADYVYTDEKTIDKRGRHSGGFFKPDWSPERMRTQMYTGRLSVLRRAPVEEAGGFDPNCEGAQDWDLVLKVTERAATVLHVPRALYHRRAGKVSAAGGGALEAGARAVQAHCDRTDVAARVHPDENHPDVCHLRPHLKGEPPVSIVIPTGGGARKVRGESTILVERCVESIASTSTYENFEIVCVFDEGMPTATLDELEEIAGEKLRLVSYDRPFSFPAKINLGVARCEGEHLLLLNDDVEVITPNWIERMVMYSRIPEVGAVGGRLLWQDGRLQHVGIHFENGLPGHEYRGFARDYGGYGNSVRVAKDLLAVTGACLMTRREHFERAGGLSESLPVNYNDIDYCLKLRAAGLRVVYDPDLLLHHFESSSRSSDVADWEKDLIRERWAHLTAVDPYSNPNLHRGMPRRLLPIAWAQGRRPWLRRKGRAA